MICPHCGYSFEREEEDALFARSLAALRRQRTKRVVDAIRDKQLHFAVRPILNVTSRITVAPQPIDPDRPH